MTLTLAALNTMDEARFVAAMGEIFEHASWAAARAAALRPFASVKDLHMAMFNAIRGQTPAERLAFFASHPELGTDRRDMTADSRAEQGGLGLDPTGLAELRQLNAAYRGRFGFPFIHCVRLQPGPAILAAARRRLKRDLASERDAAMHEIFLISGLRLADRVSGDGAPEAVAGHGGAADNDPGKDPSDA